MARSDSGV